MNLRTLRNDDFPEDWMWEVLKQKELLVFRKTASSFHKRNTLGSFPYLQSNITVTTDEWRDKLAGKGGTKH